jgi:peptide/nickel transport system ATP-binding protein
MTALLQVRGLVVEVATPAGPRRAVDGVSFTLAEGEVLGLVGESGSGKTLTCRAILRLLPRRVHIAGGSIDLAGRRVTDLPERRLGEIRGPVGAMIFQNPTSHLDPVMTIGEQIAAPIRVHEGASRTEARSRARELLEQVGIPDASRRLDQFPHEFSGGMRQRAMIAAALACRPKLLIADEPTTALDVTVQAQILRLLLDLRDRLGLAILLVTHDLGVVAQTCGRVAVMYGGRIVEAGPKPAVLGRPLHAVHGRADRLAAGIRRTRGRRSRRSPASRRASPNGSRVAPSLRAAAMSRRVQGRPAARGRAGPDPPHRLPPLARAGGGPMSAAPLLEARDVSVHYPLPRSALELVRRAPVKAVRAVDGVSLRLERGETLGIVGESGCGKSTLGRALIGLEPLSAAASAWREPTSDLPCRPPAPARADDLPGPVRRAQPDAHRRRDAGRAAPRAPPARRPGVPTRVADLMTLVGLSREFAGRRPASLSGGQAQRVGIARALSVEPDLLVADECVSALDVSIQAQVLNLLGDLRRKLGLAIVFISHDLGVVRQVCDRVAVLYLGRVVEEGPTAEVFARPRHPYTRTLIDAAPVMRPDAPPPGPAPAGEPPSPTTSPRGARSRPAAPTPCRRAAADRPHPCSCTAGTRWPAFLTMAGGCPIVTQSFTARGDDHMRHTFRMKFLLLALVIAVSASRARVRRRRAQDRPRGRLQDARPDPHHREPRHLGPQQHQRDAGPLQSGGDRDHPGPRRELDHLGGRPHLRVPAARGDVLER